MRREGRLSVTKATEEGRILQMGKKTSSSAQICNLDLRVFFILHAFVLYLLSHTEKDY